MILLEEQIGEPALPVMVQSYKAQVLTCLQTLHQLQTFERLADLDAFLDAILDQLGAAGAPRGLTRVILFHRSPAAAAAVARRLVPGGAMHVFQIPGCWMQLGRDVPTLQAWAKRAEPVWLDRHLPKGI